MCGRRVLLIGTFDPTMPRARQWQRLLDRLGCEVEVRNLPSWDVDRATKTKQSAFSMLPPVLRALWTLSRYLLTCERPDLVVFLYPGHLDACILGPIARLRRIPAVLDIFVSLYDTVVVDRRLQSERSLHALATRAVDIVACWSVPLVVVDTPEHTEFFAKYTHRSPEHFPVLWIGADESMFMPSPDPGDDADILWYLTYIPLHGFETVARAAALLSDDGRRFRLVGDGQERARAEQLASELHLDNVDFVDQIPEAELPGEIARASICLGVFGTSSKAQRVVPNKAFQCAAVGRAVITASSPAVHTAFGDAFVTVPAGDAHALASAIRGLRGDARRQAADRARAAFVDRFSDDALARQLARILSGVMRRKTAA